MAFDRSQHPTPLFLSATKACQCPRWTPLADVYQTSAGWLIKFDLAGVRPTDIHLQVHGNRLRLFGERRDAVTQQGHSYHSMEISYSAFDRSVEMPCTLDDAKIQTQYRDGMLLVEIRPLGTRV